MGTSSMIFYSEFEKMPTPSEKEINSELFESIWKVIKNWDINVPEYYDGYCGASGSHVKLILDAIKPTIRNIKIDNIINDEPLYEI